MKCPDCKSKDQMKVIYLGLPMKFCPDCHAITGLWSWVPRIWFNGYLMSYTEPYIIALFYWLLGED